MNLLIAFIVVIFVTAMFDRPKLLRRPVPLLFVCAVVSTGYLIQRVI